MPLAGRCVLPIVSSWLPYARKTPGTGAFIQTGCGYRRLILSLGALVFGSVLLLGLWPGFLVGVACSALTWASGLYSRSKIGGFSGDTLGATCELIELVPALCVVFLAHQGVV
jgi:adenosylcobinamide-GDP ribazoletransferase